MRSEWKVRIFSWWCVIKIEKEVFLPRQACDDKSILTPRFIQRWQCFESKIMRLTTIISSMNCSTWKENTTSVPVKGFNSKQPTCSGRSYLHRESQRAQTPACQGWPILCHSSWLRCPPASDPNISPHLGRRSGSTSGYGFRQTPAAELCATERMECGGRSRMRGQRDKRQRGNERELHKSRYQNRTYSGTYRAGGREVCECKNVSTSRVNKYGIWCPFSMFALMNEQRRAFLPESTKTYCSLFNFSCILTFSHNFTRCSVFFFLLFVEQNVRSRLTPPVLWY